MSASPRRKTLLVPEGFGRSAAIGWRRCGWRLSRFSALLVGDAERIGQVLLAHCKHNAAHAHPRADVLVRGFGTFFAAIVSRSATSDPLGKAMSKNRPDAGTFDLPIQRTIFRR